ncbi:hypothetical protein GCM10010168_77620 [Actinoplanes ianthinogenes]|uniref:High-affinity nickel-transport protein n=1 Tax=Actinoplanes ianthinogenes TaxID=122358 RepID=A0ABM7M9N1_9ACTN|nr:High-affinity nickel-transporter [Actinoplanes ianthinogenes]BCJ48312.1 hypothetical protein Aiant_89690 [Actinoplanes ianthinogenes]GGR47225.1 hypothetical protein GCM10010168_77620 [Actinoplanes ianthinogenes]
MKKYLLGTIVAAAGLLAWPATPAQAHPISNFSVNQYAGLTLHPDRVEVTAAVDVAEIPTLQDRTRADTDRDGTLSPAERAGYAQAECAHLASAFTVSVDGRRLTWTVPARSYAVTPGAGGLSTGRLDCTLTAPTHLADRSALTVDNAYRTDRVGWREMTAAGAGVGLAASTLPAESVSGQLRNYPRDLLSSALDVRSATIRVGAPGTVAAADRPAIRAAGPTWLMAAQTRVEKALGGHLTPLVVGLAFLLALLLGAGHAALPGHGKTVMAAYFAGRQGRIRDALAVGGTVTLAHTGGVLLLGLLLSTSTALAGEQVLTALGLTSGLLVAAVGVTMLIAARRPGTVHTHHHGPGPHARHHHHGPGAHAHVHPHRHSHTHGHHHGDGREPAHENGRVHDVSRGPAHEHGHDHGVSREREHAHGHSHEAAPDHGHGHDAGREPAHEDGHEVSHGDSRESVPGHGHAHGRGSRLRRRLGLAGIGLAGGLVPSPSALVVLLGAIGLGRAGLGVALVIAYGIGMAATLTAVGLLLVVAQRRLSHLISNGRWTGRVSARLTHWGRRAAAGAPTATAALVVLVGLGIGVRAIA